MGLRFLLLVVEEVEDEDEDEEDEEYRLLGSEDVLDDCFRGSEVFRGMDILLETGNYK